MNRKEALDLLERYERGEATDAEKQLVEAWFLSLGEREDAGLSDDREAALSRQLWKAIQRKKRSSFRYTRWLVAAAVIGVAATAVWFYLPVTRVTKKVNCLAAAMPGGNHAVLTLAGGRRLVLDSMAIGNTVAQENGVVRKRTDGEISYTSGLQQQVNSTEYNTLSTPKGGQYTITLADGSRVCLNAGSTLHFPAQFDKIHRTVTLEGEAYFDISANPHAPFIVQSAGQQVRVLGTGFNIRAYADEASVKTTLVTGKVAVNHTASGAVKLLSPGEQSRIHAGAAIDVAMVDTDEVIAWKEGYFAFTRVRLRDALKEISRWYNISFVYDEGLPADVQISGTISKYESALQVLHKIELLGEVQFTARDTHVYVSRVSHTNKPLKK